MHCSLFPNELLFRDAYRQIEDKYVLVSYIPAKTAENSNYSCHEAFPFHGSLAAPSGAYLSISFAVVASHYFF